MPSLSKIRRLYNCHFHFRFHACDILKSVNSSFSLVSSLTLVQCKMCTETKNVYKFQLSSFWFVGEVEANVCISKTSSTPAIRAYNKLFYATTKNSSLVQLLGVHVHLSCSSIFISTIICNMYKTPWKILLIKSLTFSWEQSFL